MWNGGIAQGNEDVELQWMQKKNPLSAIDADMKPTGAFLNPSKDRPQSFTGLSISSALHTLLDGMTILNDGISMEWYAIGNPQWGSEGGNPAYFPEFYSGYPAGAKKTQLFVSVSSQLCDEVNGIGTGNNYLQMIAL